MMTGYLGLFIVSILLALNAASPAIATCNRTDILQRIEDCPLPEVPFTSASVELRFQPFLLQVHQCSLWTRAYALGSNAPTIPGPTLYMQNGSSLNINMHNDLVRGSQVDTLDGVLENWYHEPNTTNLHTHGLHTSGEAPGDDPSIVIKPLENYTYSIGIPTDHASGIHLYHPHHHGSTTLQIAGGAAGMVVVDDNAENTPQGFLQDLEQIKLVIQHIEPSLLVGAGTSSYANKTHDDLTKIVSGCESEFIMVNGLINPLITIKDGHWTRLRILHISERKTVDNVTIPGCNMLLLAKDGVYLDQPRNVSRISFMQAGRVEIALKCTSAAVITSNTPQINNGTIATIQIEAAASNASAANIDSSRWSWERPLYLSDLRGIAVVDATFNISLDNRTINSQPFRGFDRIFSLHNVTLGSVEEWNLETQFHPLHVHINHMQLQETLDEWSQAGDWVDTIQADTVIRMRMDRFLGKMLMHCHFAHHADEGMTANLYVNSAPVVAATTTAPTTAPPSNVSTSAAAPTTEAPTTASPSNTVPTSSAAPTTASPTAAPDEPPITGWVIGGVAVWLTGAVFLVRWVRPLTINAEGEVP